MYIFICFCKDTHPHGLYSSFLKKDMYIIAIIAAVKNATTVDTVISIANTSLQLHYLDKVLLVLMIQPEQRHGCYDRYYFYHKD
jgi:hypothetical protein